MDLSSIDTGSIDIEHIERRDRQLWWIAVMVILVLTVTLIVTHDKGLVGATKGLSTQVKTYSVGLFLLVVLFCFYVLQSSSTFRKLRGQLLETEQDLIFTTHSKSYVDNILRSMGDSLIVVNPDGTIRTANDRTFQLLGYTPSELIGQPARRIFAEQEEEFFKGLGFSSLDPKGFIRSVEKQFLTKDGTRIPVSLSGSVMSNDDGNIQGIVCVIRDISERKRTRDLLERYAKELARSNAELEQFAWVASHDLQEPLRMVASYTQLLARRYKGKLDSDADEFIAYAVGGATRMRRLINDLLEYSRVGTRGKDFEPTDCETVLEGTLTDLQTLIEDSGAVVTRDPLPTLMADATQLGQLFQNLIANATKFRSSETLKVHVGVERKNGAWLFSVRDNGIGIEPDYWQRIFIVFQRVHGAEDYPGTGIGLAICKKIVERHSGRIWVESQPGDGATFYFTIPISGDESP